MNIFTSLAHLALVPALMFATNAADGAVTVVYPTGINPTDVQNVQAALNQGGSVLLKAVNKSGQAQSFNFGTWNASISAPANSQVNLVTDVAISGETVGSARTTIAGGVTPFTESGSGAKVSITGLKFVNPQWSAITILRSNGISITNNEIDGVLPFLNGSGFTESSGVYLNGAGGSITGSVTFTGNYIHGLDGQYEFGLQDYAVGVTSTISSNTIDIGYATDAAAGTVDCEGIAVGRCPGASNVTGNNVSVGPGVGLEAIAVYGPTTGATTIAGNEVTIAKSAICYEGIGINGTTGTAQVVGNVINSESEYADAIALAGDNGRGGITGATVAANAIDVEDSIYGAIGLYGAVSKSSISLNLITGNSAYALSASSDGISTDLCSSNSFLANLILGFTATDATIFLDTNTVNNVVRGPYSSAINKGTGNSLSTSLF